MALDSLIATEVKNWITNTMQVPIRVNDILDAPNLRSLATFISEKSTLVKFNESGQGQGTAENVTTNGTTTSTESF